MLPLCFGQATKVAGLLLDADKTYEATLALGSRTATGDTEGEVVERVAVPVLEAERVAAVLAGFLGEGEQVPPMYSALKKDGEPLYARARRGETVERAPRRIRIDAIGLLDLRDEVLRFTVTCSKGTYVRTLGEDIALALGTVGHLAGLRRTSVGGAFAGCLAHPLEALEALAGDPEALDALLVPADAALPQFPALTLDAAGEAALRHGQSVVVPAPPGLSLRLYGPGERFLGLGEAAADGGSVRTLRLMSEGFED